jgi:hypothetical protein
MIRKSMLAAAILAITALGGCGVFDETQKGPLIVGGGNTISDVPVPAGFKYQEKGSSSIVDIERKYRQAIQVYYGKAALARVAEFYQEQLPKNKWSPTTMSQQVKQIVVTASKPNETVTVRAWDDTFFTYIEISLMPATPTTKSK